MSDSQTLYVPNQDVETSRSNKCEIKSILGLFELNFEVYCPDQGPDNENTDLTVIVEDRKIPVGEADRAKKTVPPVFEIKNGVFALTDIPPGIQLGPYEGEVTLFPNTDGKEQYSWKLFNGKLADTADETVSNWMRYVGCAPHYSKQNVIAFQYSSKMYFRTIKTIKKGKEMLAYYGNSSAYKESNLEDYFNPEHKKPAQNYFLCQHCQVGLNIEKQKEAHELRCSARNRFYSGEAFECCYCQLLFTNVKDRDGHTRNCPKKSNLRRYPNVIKQEHEQLLRCEDCNYTTKSKYYLATHLKLHHKDTATKFKCDLCPFSTIHRSNLTSHKKTHNKEHTSSVFKCESCPYTTGERKYLTAHIKKHSHVGTFLCDICQQAFNRKRGLDHHYLHRHKSEPDKWQHLITHKVFKCSSCDYSTVRTSDYKNHLKIHENDSSLTKFTFTCDTCGFKCIRKSDLTRHLLIHNKEPAYSCKVCDKKFNRKDQQDNHVVCKHPDNLVMLATVTNKIHKCGRCAYQTCRMSDFKTHLKTCRVSSEKQTFDS